jgi:hypothetical protein
MNDRFVFLCVIAVLLNGVIALGWALWREGRLNDKLMEQVIELQNQAKRK